MKNLIWTNSWLQQSEAFYQYVAPTPLADPYFVHCNEQVARLFRLSPKQLNSDSNLRCFNGDEIVAQLSPIATVYAGHQFGIFTSKLGDGRAILLGEVLGFQGDTYEVQLKGAGLTPFSRTLNGRYLLSDALREYLASEALSGIGIPCTRALCLLGSRTEIGSGTAAILVRIARSHLRFGHFEYFHHLDDFDAVRRLFNFVLEQHFPELLNEAPAQRPLKFLEIVIMRTARLIASWQSVGFTHGVMNTDNMTLSGETLDLGPFGFMEAYDPAFSPNPSDDQNRYQFDQQADIGRWNCLALAQAVSSLLATPTIPAGLLRLYRQTYQQLYLQIMREKLGLYTQHDGDREFIYSLLIVLTHTHADYTDFFRNLAQFETGCKSQDLFPDIADVDLLQSWLHRYQERLAVERRPNKVRRKAMNQLNPAYILRESILNKVIQSAEKGDFTELDRVMVLLKNPYQELFT